VPRATATQNLSGAARISLHQEVSHMQVHSPYTFWTRIRGPRSLRRVGAHLAVAALTLTATGSAVAEQSLTIERKTLSLAAARKIVAAAEAEATSRRLGVVIVVVDDTGNIIELTRMDSAQVASVNVGIGKARTAAIYRRPSRDFEEQIKNGRVAALALADATPLQGGVPILIDGHVAGAVGVSGDTPQADEEIALAGAKAVGR
jgi:glc operon protein GlcG